MSEKKRFVNKKYFLCYTLLFGVMACLVYCHFFLNGKSFIYTDDGWKQHFKALVYYAKWLRSIVYNLIKNHVFEIPQFSFSIGYGSDILTTLHYYVIGDPLNLFSVLVPTRYMAYFYSGLVLVRLYLAGLGFSCFCFYNKVKSKTGIMAGAMSYAFCGFALYAAVRHPYFANPMIYFPFLLLGVEKILREKKPWIFMITVCISAMSSFYFFYMLVLLTVLYVCGRLICIYGRKQIKGAVIALLKIGGYSIIGVMMSAVILFPVLLLFANNPRSANKVEYSLIYAKQYYEQFLTGFITYKAGGHWNFMGYSAMALLAVILLFLYKKRRTFQKAAFILLTVFLLLPTAGYIFNGFSYVSNRWVWGYSMLVSFILASMWEDFFTLSKIKKILLLLLGSCYFKVCIDIGQNYNIKGVKFAVYAGVMILVAVLVSGVIKKKWYRCFVEYGVFCLVLMNIISISYYEYSPQKSKYLNEFLDIAQVYNELLANEARPVSAVAEEEEFYRYSGDVYNATNANSTLISGLSSVQFYWSLSNSTIAPFMEQMYLMDNSAYNYKKLDNRTALNSLAGVKYYVTYKKANEAIGNYAPFGYKLQPIEDDVKNIYDVYKNQYALPLGYTYTKYISKEEYEQLNPLEKQEALLQGILLEEEPDDKMKAELELSSQEKEYRVVCSSEQVSQQGNSFVVTAKNESVTLEFDGCANSETYLIFENLHYKGFSIKSMYSDDKKIDPFDLYTEEDWNALSEAERERQERRDQLYKEPSELWLQFDSRNTEGQVTTTGFFYRTPRYSWYAGRHDFAVNTCYDETAKTSITITFPSRGIYSFDELKVVCQPMDNYPEQIEALRSDCMEEVDLHNDNIAYATNKVTGKISLEESKILCVTIPYSTGWKAYVDGTERELLQANAMFMALSLEEGEHKLCFVYQTPGLTAGICFSGLGCLCFAGLLIIDLKKKKMYKR